MWTAGQTGLEWGVSALGTGGLAQKAVLPVLGVGEARGRERPGPVTRGSWAQSSPSPSSAGPVHTCHSLGLPPAPAGLPPHTLQAPAPAAASGSAKSGQHVKSIKQHQPLFHYRNQQQHSSSAWVFCLMSVMGASGPGPRAPAGKQTWRAVRGGCREPPAHAPTTPGDRRAQGGVPSSTTPPNEGVPEGGAWGASRRLGGSPVVVGPAASPAGRTVLSTCKETECQCDGSQPLGHGRLTLARPCLPGPRPSPTFLALKDGCLACPSSTV